MSSGVGAPAVPSRPTGRWPGRPLLASRLREILRREFGVTDAWVVHTPGRCRLEARIDWRIVVLLESDEATFWAPFYTTAIRNRYMEGSLVPVAAPTQRRRGELLEILRPLWAGVPAAGESPMPGA